MITKMNPIKYLNSSNIVLDSLLKLNNYFKYPNELIETVLRRMDEASFIRAIIQLGLDSDYIAISDRSCYYAVAFIIKNIPFKNINLKTFLHFLDQVNDTQFLCILDYIKSCQKSCPKEVSYSRKRDYNIFFKMEHEAHLRFYGHKNIYNITNYARTRNNNIFQKIYNFFKRIFKL